jgi:hypothetical protein
MATKATPKPWIVFLILPLLILICEIGILSVGQSSLEQYQLESRGEISLLYGISAGRQIRGSLLRAL